MRCALLRALSTITAMLIGRFSNVRRQLDGLYDDLPPIN